jgi:hypothetical protein
MFFPAGIPFVAVIALIIWSAREETARTQSGGGSKRS